MIYDSVSADLSNQFLEAIPGSVEEKLLFLQDQLGEDFPNIVIQYVCGDDTSIVQIKGQWPDVKNIHCLLASWMESLTKVGEKEKDTKLPSLKVIDDELNISNLQQNTCNKGEMQKTLASIKTENIVETVNEREANLCEYCGKACSKLSPDPEVKDQDAQTDELIIDENLNSNDLQALNPGKKGKPKHNIVTLNSQSTDKQALVALSSLKKTRSGRIVRPTPKTQKDTNKPVKDQNVEKILNTDELGSEHYVVTENELEEDISDGDHTAGEEDLKVDFEEEQNQNIDRQDSDNSNTNEVGEKEDGSNNSTSNFILLTDIPEIVCEPSGADENTNEESRLETIEVNDIQLSVPIITGSARGRKRKSAIFGEGKMISESQVKELIAEIMAKIETEAPEGSVDIPHVIPCTLCDYRTSQKRHLRSHIFRCHVHQTNSCFICGKTYGLPKDLRFHLKSHNPEHNCSQCDRKFPSRSILKQHIDNYHNADKERKRALKGMMQKCEFCDYTNDQLKNIKDHVARHHMERQYACLRCPKVYALKKDLVTHVKSHDARFECDKCNKVLRSKIALKVHENAIHLGIKNRHKKEHMCDHCGHICRSKTHYNEHLNREHLNVRPFGCPLCKMAFYTNSALRSHLTTHTDSRKYSCSTCDKRFKHKTSLKMHEITHKAHNTRPYQCETCRKGFSQKGALMRHMRIHTGEKPYACRLCESSFTDYSILRRHMLGVHKVNSKSLCQRADVAGNKGGPKPEKTIVEDIEQYKNIIRTPVVQKEENEEEEHLMAMVTKSAMEAQNELKQSRYQSIRPRTEIIDPSGNTIQVEIASSHSELGDLKGLQPMNIVPISSMEENGALGSDNIYINSGTSESQSLNEVSNANSSDIHEYFVAEVNTQMPQELSGIGAGYTVLQAGSGGLGSVSNVVSDFVGTGMASLPFTVQTIPSQDGEPIAIQIIQSGVQH